MRELMRHSWHINSVSRPLKKHMLVVMILSMKERIYFTPEPLLLALPASSWVSI